MKKYIKKIVISCICFLLVTTILAFTTFENLGNGFSVFGKTFLAGNEIQDNTCSLKFYWSDNPTNNSWKDTEEATVNVAFDSDDLWEPGKTEIRYFKVQNTDTCSFGYDFRVMIEDENLPQIADVLNVYFLNDVTSLQNSISGFTFKGSLSDCYIDTLYHCDELESGSYKICALAFVMDAAADNTYQGSANSLSFSILVNPLRLEEPEPELTGEFGISLPDRNILYRVGNNNTIPVSKIFYARDTSNGVNSNFDYNKITFRFPTSASDINNRIAGNAFAAYTKNSSTWDDGTLKFTNSGVVTVELLYDGDVKASINLEVVSGNNVYKATTSPSTTDGNTVLLCDVTVSGSSVTSGYTLYGNGFSLIDGRKTSASTTGTAGMITLSNGTLDNVRVIGYDYPELTTNGVSNPWYANCVSVRNGKNYILNSYITGCRYALHSTGTNKFLHCENTTISGGTYANLCCETGTVVLKDCTTSNSPTSSLRGLGLYIKNTQASVVLEETFNQYNWIRQDDFPDINGLKTIVSGLYGSGSSYPFCKTYNGTKYCNVGIVFFDEGTGFTEAVSRQHISDTATSDYHFYEKTAMGYTATLYDIYASGATDAMVQKSIFPDSEFNLEQYPTLPNTVFDYTNLNYIAKTADSNKYCYYDSNSETVYISFESTESSFSWNPMILTASKYGSSIPYTVTMNNQTYTGNISFTQSGDYTVKYSYTDLNLYYSPQAVNGSADYEKEVKINVTVCDPAVRTYPPEFTFGNGGTYNQGRKSVVANNKTYVMPDVTETSSSIGSTTIDGQTIFFPIVTVNPTGSNGNSSYSSGKGYYFAPAFSAVRIIDYNQDNGNVQYTYNTSATKWPHNNGATTGPNTDILSYVSGMPYEGSGGAGYRKFNSNNNGLCYTTNDYERNVSASSQTVCFRYKGNDGNDYYYYIKYSFTALTYKSGGCFAEGTDITLADGSTGKVEDITYSDRILSWNFFTGKAEGKDLCIIINHGENKYAVLNSVFSDGTVLRTIDEHGVFDATLNKFVYLSPDTYRQYLGHKFIKVDPSGSYSKVKLTDAYVTEEVTTAYSVTSDVNCNAVAQGILTIPPYDNFYNYFKVGRNLRYASRAFKKDIEKYGMYEYDDFKEYISYDVFKNFNLAYIKVSVGKGLITYDEIIGLIELYSGFLEN